MLLASELRLGIRLKKEKKKAAWHELRIHECFDRAKLGVLGWVTDTKIIENVK